MMAVALGCLSLGKSSVGTVLAYGHYHGPLGPHTVPFSGSLWSAQADTGSSFGGCGFPGPGVFRAL